MVVWVDVFPFANWPFSGSMSMLLVTSDRLLSMSRQWHVKAHLTEGLPVNAQYCGSDLKGFTKNGSKRRDSKRTLRSCCIFQAKRVQRERTGGEVVLGKGYHLTNRLHGKHLARWWQLTYFLEFSPRSLGFHDDPIWLAHIFQMGWWTNHQLAGVSPWCFCWIHLMCFSWMRVS